MGLRKAAFAFLLSLFGSHAAQAQADSTIVSVLYFAPGDEIYEAFGHAAFRIQDRQAASDRIYNFGTFDLQEPGFVWRFAKGRLDYYLSTATTGNYLARAQQRDVLVTEQVLNLSTEQARKLQAYLVELAKPENRSYSYHFFRDNCSTRIIKSLKESLNPEAFAWPDSLTEDSWRSSALPMMERYSWAKAGSNLALGVPADRRISLLEKAYLPKDLAILFSKTEIEGQDLVVLEKVLLNPVFSAQRPGTPWASTAVLCFSLFILLVLFVELLASKNFWPIDYLVFGGLGLTGLALCLFWIFTDHPFTWWNFNFLWANPLFLIFAVFGHKWYFRRRFGLYSGLFLGLTVAIFPLLPQSFPLVFMPLVLVGIFRSVIMYLKN